MSLTQPQMLLIRFGLGLLLLACSAAGWSQDFGFILGEGEVSGTQRSNTLNDVILKTKGGFKGELDIKVSVEPDVPGLDISIDGARDGKVSSDSINVYVDAYASRYTPAGEYEVTVELSGDIEGRRVVRKQSYILRVESPPEFDLLVAPAKLVIKQGQSAETVVTTLFGEGASSPVDLSVLIPGTAPGLSAEIRSGGDLVWDAGGVAHWLVSAPANRDGFVDSLVNVSADPATPPGEYVLSAEGTLNPLLAGQKVDHKRRTRKHNAPLYVTVVADPQYAGLQDPPNFELLAEATVFVLGPGTRQTWVGAWGDRWDESVKLGLSMRTPGGPVSIELLGNRILRLPTNSRAYSVDAWVVVSPGTAPGDYPAKLTGESRALNGKKLTKELDLIIRVPPPPAEREAAPAEPDSIAAMTIPVGGTVAPEHSLSEEEAWEEAAEEACEMLSEPSETIACSVHTFRKPETGNADPKDDLSIGNTVSVPEEEGGGFDTELFIRNPDDNNLRKGCGDLNPEVLTQLSGMSWPPAQPSGDRVQYEVLACNAAAQAGQKKRVFVSAERNRRAFHSTDDSDARAVGYKRRQDRSYTRSDGKNLRGVVGDAMTEALNDGRTVKSCPRPPSRRPDTQVDPKFDKVPEDIRNTYKNGVRMLDTSVETAERIKAASDTLAGLSDTTTHLGTEYAVLKTTSDSVKLGLSMSEMVVKGASGERITALEARDTVSLVADITGSKTIKTVSSSFDALLSLENLRIRIKNGEKITPKDIADLAGKIDGVRGERFKALGDLLGGIKKNAERIEKATDMVEQLGKVSEFLDKVDEAQKDPVKASELFGEYLGMLGSVAEKVPGMGEFVAAYADAVKGMQGNIESIAESVKKRNDAIDGFDRTVEGTYQRIELDAEQFESDFNVAPAGRRLSADQINVNREVADELEAAEDARRHWQRLQRCVLQASSKMEAYRRQEERLTRRWKELSSTPQATLEDRAARAEARAEYVRAWGQTTRGLEFNSSLLDDMGFASKVELENFLGKGPVINGKKNYDNNLKNLDKFADRARRAAGERALLRQQYAENTAAWREAKRRRDECAGKLPAAEVVYLQALRDYTAEYAHYSLYLIEDRRQWKESKRQQLIADALAAIDAQIVKQGFLVENGRVVLVLVDACQTRERSISVGG